MAELSRWKEVFVPQRYETGCIPSGFEWMIRYMKIEGVNLDSFQDDFDLQRLGEGNNSFIPIAVKVKEFYPQVDIKIRDFPSGEDTVLFMKELIKEDVPCVMSLACAPIGRWHIVPVISVNNQRMKILWVVNDFGYQLHDYPRSEIVFRHNNWNGGKDIAWIEE